MTDSVIVAELLNHGLFAEGGATVNVAKPHLELKNCFVIGGAGKTHTGDKDYFYEHIVEWVTESIYEGATHVGVWLDPETDIVHYDSLTVIALDTKYPWQFVNYKEVARSIASLRDEIAYGYFGPTGKYETYNV